MQIAQQLAEENLGELLIVEPNINQLPTIFEKFKNVKKVSVETALNSADIFLGLVDHDQFKELERDKLQEKIVIDMRGMWR